MKSRIFAFAPFPALAAALALAGCATPPTKVSSGTIKASTFNFVNVASKPAPVFIRQEPLLHELVQKAITTSLANKGVSRVASGGDVTVAYLLIAANNVSTTSVNAYFGLRDETAALESIAHEAATVENKNPNFFESGTLLIDIIDNRDFKLLSRNHITDSVIRDLGPDARQARIQGAVDRVLSGVRFSPRQ